MSCFLVPLVQAAATTIYRKHFCKTDSDSHPNVLKRNVPALEKMLWGGSIMLIVDHIINGELTWRFPFFTALTAESGASVFWGEILTVGVPMSVVLTLVWILYAVIKERKTAKNTQSI